MATEYGIVTMPMNVSVEYAVKRVDGVIIQAVDALPRRAEPRDAETLDALISNNADHAAEDGEWLQGLIDSAGYDPPVFTPADRAETQRQRDIADGV